MTSVLVLRSEGCDVGMDEGVGSNNTSDKCRLGVPSQIGIQYPS